LPARFFSFLLAFFAGLFGGGRAESHGPAVAYGPPPDMELRILSGRVRHAASREVIAGIRVRLLADQEILESYSNRQGGFSFRLRQPSRIGILVADDVDGPTNGSFRSATNRTPVPGRENDILMEPFDPKD
jgi:hypothetical protein